jgi:hypothetical protein
MHLRAHGGEHSEALGASHRCCGHEHPHATEHPHSASAHDAGAHGHSSAAHTHEHPRAHDHFLVTRQGVHERTVELKDALDRFFAGTQASVARSSSILRAERPEPCFAPTALTQVCLAAFDAAELTLGRDPDLRSMLQQLREALPRMLLEARALAGDPKRLRERVATWGAVLAGVAKSGSKKLRRGFGRFLDVLTCKPEVRAWLTAAVPATRRLVHKLGSTLAYAGHAGTAAGARLLGERHPVMAVVVAITWPLWTAASEAAEHVVMGPLAAVCIVSQVLYWRLVNDVSGAVEQWAHARGFNADNASAAERAQTLTQVRALAKELRTFHLGADGRPITQSGLARAATASLAAAGEHHCHHAPALDALLSSGLWPHLAARATEATPPAEAQAFWNALLTDAERVVDAAVSPLVRSEQVGQATAALRLVGELLGRYAQGLAFSEPEIQRSLGLQHRLGKLDKHLGRLDYGLRALILGTGDAHASTAHAERVALAWSASLGTLRALYREAQAPQDAPSQAATRAALLHLDAQIDALYSGASSSDRCATTRPLDQKA